MKEIIFKNGSTLVVSQKIANVIRDRIIEGAKQFQCFTEGDDPNVTIIVNVSEIVSLKDQFVKAT